MSSAKATEAELIALCPDFAAAWAEEHDLWVEDDGSFTVHAVVIAFSHFVAARVSRGPDDLELQRIFRFVESHLMGDEGFDTDPFNLKADLDNALTTCFLENLMNRVPETIAPSDLVPLLGPKSRAFCRAYDECCGTKTAVSDNAGFYNRPHRRPDGTPCSEPSRVARRMQLHASWQDSRGG